MRPLQRWGQAPVCSGPKPSKNEPQPQLRAALGAGSSGARGRCGVLHPVQGSKLQENEQILGSDCSVQFSFPQLSLSVQSPAFLLSAQLWGVTVPCSVCPGALPGSSPWVTAFRDVIIAVSKGITLQCVVHPFPLHLPPSGCCSVLSQQPCKTRSQNHPDRHRVFSTG